MIKLFRRVVLALALVVAAYAGFRWGPAVFPRVEALLGIGSRTAETAEPQPSAELADAALDRFERFRAGEGGERLALGSTELTSVVRYSLPGLLPPGVSEPEVRLREGKVHVSARVAVESFPRLPELGQVVGLLPDTLLMSLRGSLVPLDQAHLALVVDRVEAAHIPVPARMMSQVLDGLRGTRAPGVPRDALAVPLPDGLASVFVERDSLVLVSETEGDS
jgi:hypothetical protein